MASRGRQPKGRGGGKREARIDLLKAVGLLQECMTEAVCQTVFQLTRTTERVREWTLKALVDFWTAVTLRAPPSLTMALQEAQEGSGNGWPQVPATSKQGFFERCKDLRWEFFANLYAAFRDRLVPKALPVFCAPIAPLLKEFPNIWAIDGSRLDAVAHRLKILWDERSVVLPGCLEVCYDLVRGIPRVFRFNPDAAASEMGRAGEALEEVPAETLLLGDRLYASVAYFGRLKQKGIWGLFRRHRSVKLRKLKQLGRLRLAGGILEDWLVEAGSGQTAVPQRLRWVRFRRGQVPFDCLTNVLDPKRLPADLAWALYPYRWSIERMFYDLKEILNLHCFYASNPNAVAMQVYAAAMVYTALRVAQGHGARDAGVQPEIISTQKFFPRVAAASIMWTAIKLVRGEYVRANPGRKIHEPAWRRRGFAFVCLNDVRVEKRKDHRRHRRFCISRARWMSYAHVRGGNSLLRN